MVEERKVEHDPTVISMAAWITELLEAIAKPIRLQTRMVAVCKRLGEANKKGKSLALSADEVEAVVLLIALLDKK